MAKRNQILLTIGLDGDSEVKRKLADVGETGKRSLSDIEKKLGSARNAFRDSAGGLKEALAPLSEASGLGSLLSGAGLARFATGPAVIGAGITAALLKLAEFGESVQRTKGRLSALGDDKGFERLTERAKKSGVAVSDLQSGYEDYLAELQKVDARNRAVIHPEGFKAGAAEEAASQVRILGGGGQLNAAPRGNFEKFDDALRAQIRRDVKSSDEANRVGDQFKQSLFKQGLTPDALRSLQKSSPNAADFVTSQLSKSLSQGFINPNALAASIEGGRIPQQKLTATEVINAGARPNEEFEKAAESARGLTQQFEAVSAAAKRLAEGLGGDHAGIGKVLDYVTGKLNVGADNSDRLLNPRDYEPGGPKFIGPVNETERQRYNSPGLEGSLDTIKWAPILDFLGRAFAAPGDLQEKQGPRPAEERRAAASQSSGASADVVGAVSDVTAALQQLAPAIQEAVADVKNSTSPASQPVEVQGKKGGGFVRHFGHGGGVSGPGTPTSDSIPAMLSDGEYVIKESSARKLGRGVLDWINRGAYAVGGFVRRLAGGGDAAFSQIGNAKLSLADLGPGDHTVLADPDTGGAYIDGLYYPPGSPILDDPIVRRKIQESLQGTKASSKKSKYKSSFVGQFGEHAAGGTIHGFAGGGAVGGLGALSQYIARRAGGGGMISLPHFDVGGMAGLGAGPAPQLSDLAPGGGLSDLADFGRVEMADHLGNFKVIAHRSVVDELKRAAVEASTVQASPRPSWYGR